MPINAEYRGPGDLPEVIPVFPLPGALLLPRGPMPLNADYRGPGGVPEVIPVFRLPGPLRLPRGQMPLNIFEPRYLSMVDDAFRDGHRLIGMIQPDAPHSPDSEKPALFRIGCVGRITQLAETGDGRY